ncbi:hypothetical protein Y888_19035 [Mixta calida B021323]|nr:hypothetical protein Y888_19035 [Mixta calida B021323]
MAISCCPVELFTLAIKADAEQGMTQRMAEIRARYFREKARAGRRGKKKAPYGAL